MFNLTCRLNAEHHPIGPCLFILVLKIGRDLVQTPKTNKLEIWIELQSHQGMRLQPEVFNSAPLCHVTCVYESPISADSCCSYALRSLFHPHEVLARPMTDIEALDISAFSDTPSNIRASSLELSGMRLDSPPPTPRGTPDIEGPSALSILLSQNNSSSSVEQDSEQQPVEDVQSVDPCQPANGTPAHTPEIGPSVQEATPLIQKVARPQHRQSYGSSTKSGSPVPRRFIRLPSLRTILRALPAVVLGLLLNILDGLSYGLITFPNTGVFEGFGGTGVSMFFVTYCRDT